MAITINTQPSNNLFAYRPLIMEVQSDSTAIVRCIADVYVGGAYKASLENSPDLGETDVFTFDVQGIIQDNLSNIDFYTSSNAVTRQDVQKNYQVKFYEVTTNGTVFSTTWAEDGAGSGSVDSSTLIAYNGTLEHTETNSITPFQYGGAYGMLSKAVKPIRIKRGDIAFITSVGQGATNEIYLARIIQYDSSDNLISTTNTTSYSLSGYYCQLGRYNTTSLAANCAYFTMQIRTSLNDQMTDLIRFDVVEDINGDYQGVYWFNSVGGFDYHLFEGKKQKNVRSTTNKYKKAVGTSVDSWKKGNTLLSVEGVEEFELYTRPQTEARMRHLAELITHKTDTYIYDGTNFVPILITSASERINDSSNTVGQFQITYQMSNKRISQKA